MLCLLEKQTRLWNKEINKLLNNDALLLESYNRENRIKIIGGKYEKKI